MKSTCAVLCWVELQGGWGVELFESTKSTLILQYSNYRNGH